jgi:uncharacterized protein YndB with AHSA1/START domain
MIHVEAYIQSDLEKVWENFTNPKHIQNWNFASLDWHCPKAANDLRVDGKFSYTMAAKDASFSFDFEGTYTLVEPLSSIEYNIIDGRKVIVKFSNTPNGVLVTEDFDPEQINAHEMQQGGWQSILNQFKTYTEQA